MHFTITFAGETNVYQYTGNIVLKKPKIVKPGFHCMRLFNVLASSNAFLMCRESKETEISEHIIMARLPF